MAKFPHVSVNIHEDYDADGVRVAVYHALNKASEPALAERFAENAAGLDRETVVAMAGELVTVTFTGEAAAGEPYDLDDRSLPDGLAIIAWRGLSTPDGDEDRAQGNGPPQANAAHWMVTVDDDHGVEPLNNFLKRAAASGWTVTSATPLGTVEQNSDSETWLPEINLRDTRFTRVLTQMIFLSRNPT